MSFFFQSSASISEGSSSLASSPRSSGGLDELATATLASKSPTTATSTTRAPTSSASFSPKAGFSGGKNGNGNDDDNDNGNEDSSSHTLFSRAEKVVQVYHGQYTPANGYVNQDPPVEDVQVDPELSELGISRSSSGTWSLDYDDNGISSGSSVSSGSVVSRRYSKRRRSKESEKVVNSQDTSSVRTHRPTTVGDAGMFSAAAQASLQDASISRPSRAVSPPIPPRDHGHRRRTSGVPSVGNNTPRKRKWRSRRWVVQERGFSRDFLLIVALCVGFACAIVLVARPAMLVLVQPGGGLDLD